MLNGSIMAVAKLLFVIVGLYPLYLIWRSVRYRLAARKLHCSTPIRYKHRDPVFGLDLFLKRVEAMKLGEWLTVDEHLFSTYGKTVLTNAFGKKQYVTMDSRNIQTEKIGSAPMNHAVTVPLIGNGSLSTDVERWKRSRQLVNPIFTRAQVLELSTFEIYVRRMLDLVPPDGSTIDMQRLC
ncbi:hypothetical protein B7494_g3968 [Chlorociboria aeruginascens]|nr:hypothetical protein B7494_g3968 [Chlorociboria aeruginascens]